MKKMGLVLALVMLAAALRLSGGREPLPGREPLSGGAVPAEGEAEIPAGEKLPAEEKLFAGEKYVALTFDDGPKAGTTERLLDGLKERGATATFFLIGEQIEDNAALVTRMAEEGHQIGNHTWSHKRLEGASPDEAAHETARTEAALEALLGGGEYWLRPPYGGVNAGTEASFGVPLVKWSVDPRDWESRDTEKVVRAILENTEPNSIILLHDIYPTSVDAALRVVDRLQEEGYWFVTVEELLRLNGVKPEAGIMYRTGRG